MRPYLPSLLRNAFRLTEEQENAAVAAIPKGFTYVGVGSEFLIGNDGESLRMVSPGKFKVCFLVGARAHSNWVAPVGTYYLNDPALLFAFRNDSGLLEKNGIFLNNWRAETIKPLPPALGVKGDFLDL